MSELMKGVFRGVRREIANLANAVLKSGSANVGRELANMQRDENQPLGFTFGTITNSLKTGAIATGKDLMNKGLERIKESSPQEQNSEMSEESTWTEQPAEQNSEMSEESTWTKQPVEQNSEMSEESTRTEQSAEEK
jgi:hypothetical protein